jgi:hypothetical protein
VRTADQLRTRIAIACIGVSLAVVIAVEVIGEGDPLFSPFTTLASGQYQGVATIVFGVALIAGSFCVLARTWSRSILATLSVVFVYGGSFVLNTRLFDSYQLDRERHPSTWYLATVLPLTIAALGLVLGWLIAWHARGREWLMLLVVLWVPLLYGPLFRVALAGGDDHAGWQVDALTAFADAMTEAYELALLIFAPLILVMVLSSLLRRQLSRIHGR